MKRLAGGVTLPSPDGDELIGLTSDGTLLFGTAAAVEQRLNGSLAAAVMAVERGARLLRVHDVKETVEAIKMAWAVIERTEESL